MFLVVSRGSFSPSTILLLILFDFECSRSSSFYTFTNLMRKFKNIVKINDKAPKNANGPTNPTSKLNKAPTNKPDIFPTTK